MSQIPVSGGIFYTPGESKGVCLPGGPYLREAPGAGFSLYKFAVNDCVRGLGGRIQNRLKKL